MQLRPKMRVAESTTRLRHILAYMLHICHTVSGSDAPLPGLSCPLQVNRNIRRCDSPAPDPPPVLPLLMLSLATKLQSTLSCDFPPPVPPPPPTLTLAYALPCLMRTVILCVHMQSFSVVMNQHSPVSDSAAHFLVTLKRPEQRQLDQQRKVSFPSVAGC